jgi:AcrR family transcriptional regulator
MDPVKSKPPRPRGRPKSEAARNAVLSVAAELIANEGIGAVTMEAVARISGVGKPTLYRSWRNREELAMAALLKDGMPETSLRETSSAFKDLLQHIKRVVAIFSNPKGRNVALMVASADADSELSKAFRNQVILASRNEGRLLIMRGLRDGSIRPGINVDTVLDMIYGPVFYRLLIGHLPLSDAFAKLLLREIRRGISLSKQK